MRQPAIVAMETLLRESRPTEVAAALDDAEIEVIPQIRRLEVV